MTGRPLAGDLDAILADYKAGVPTKTIVTRHGVSAETVRTYARNAGLKSRKGRPGICRLCSREAVLYLGQCRDCRAEIPLTNGHWAPDHRGVQRWVPDPVVMSDDEWRRLKGDELDELEEAS